MKKFFPLIVSLIWLCNYTYAQTTIKTPRNVSIAAAFYTEASTGTLEDWEEEAAEWLDDHNSHADSVGPASATYNCHGWAWHMKDEGDTVWISAQNNTNDSIENIINYWTGSAPTYESTVTSSEATVAFYGSCWYYDSSEEEWKNPCDHSVQVISSTEFESKWGAWGRYRHSPNDCPYDDTDITYYKIPITGDDDLCTTSSKTYSTHNISGASYSWSGNKVSVSGNSYSESATGTSGGNGYISVDIYSPFSETTVTAKKNITVNTPPTTPGAITIQMNSPPRRFTASINPVSGATSYNWYKDYSLQTSHADAVICTRISPYCGNEYYVQVEALNNCGTSLKNNTWATEPDCGYWFVYYPNPTENEININAIDQSTDKLWDTSEVDFSVNLYDVNKALLKSAESVQNEITINVKDLLKGTYFLHIIDNDKDQTIQEQIILDR